MGVGVRAGANGAKVPLVEDWLQIHTWGPGKALAVFELEALR